MIVYEGVSGAGFAAGMLHLGFADANISAALEKYRCALPTRARIYTCVDYC